MNYIEGNFVSERPNRFLCEIAINGKSEICHLASSSKLTPFINPSFKTVLLTENKSNKSKTKYTLHAVKLGKKYILLN